MATARNQTALANSPSAPRATKTAPSTPIQNPDKRETQEERIRFRAYLLAEAAGFPDGRADEFWHQAEKEIRSGKGW
jgi:hypothetical protein